jgi:hypothetical protein
MARLPAWNRSFGRSFNVPILGKEVDGVQWLESASYSRPRIAFAGARGSSGVNLAPPAIGRRSNVMDCSHRLIRPFKAGAIFAR